MALDDGARWDDIYRQRALEPYPVPDALLVAYAPPPVRDDVPTVALDIACGLGQNALWLAEYGYCVEAMDVSRIALNRGHAEMTMRNLRNVNFKQVDLEQIELQMAPVALICCFRYLDRRLLPQFQRALPPGGMLITQAFNVGRLAQKPDTNPAFVLELGEMPAHFPEWEVLHHEETDEFTRFVARKPVK